MNTELLKALATATAAGTLFYVSQADGLPLLKNDPALISVDPAKVDPTDASKIAATITEAGAKLISGLNGTTQTISKADVGTLSAKPIAQVMVGTGFARPKVKRGGGGGSGAPVKYPFDTLEVGQFFFIPNSEVAKGDAFKTLGSAVGSANQRYAKDTGETHQVTRAKRGADHKTIKGADGKNVMETVTLPKKVATRRFVVNKVTAGVTYGVFTAPADGAVVLRDE